MSGGPVYNPAQPYRIPKLIDCNACSRALRSANRLLIIGRCVEREHPEALSRFPNHAPLSVCLEEEHVNMVGFKLAGMLARLGSRVEEVAVLTVDGSLHCVQLHFMVEEVFKVLGAVEARRKHFIVSRRGVEEIPLEAVRTARHLSKVARLLGGE